jgi:hypothetical protein
MGCERVTVCSVGGIVIVGLGAAIGLEVLLWLPEMINKLITTTRTIPPIIIPARFEFDGCGLAFLSK